MLASVPEDEDQVAGNGRVTQLPEMRRTWVKISPTMKHHVSVEDTFAYLPN